MNIHGVVVVFDASFSFASFDAVPPRENAGAAGAVMFDAGAGVLGLAPKSPPPRRPPPAAAGAVVVVAGAAAGAEPNNPPDSARRNEGSE